MDTPKTLIDRAVQMCGGEAELAHALGVQRQLVHGWYHGHRAITPETVALLGDVLQLPGEEVQRLAAWAVVENAKNAGKRERLKRAFFGVWVSGVVLLPLAGTPTEAQAKEPNAVLQRTLYTLSLAVRAALRARVRNSKPGLTRPRRVKSSQPICGSGRLRAAACGL